jgi:hypothetical protein
LAGFFDFVYVPLTRISPHGALGVQDGVGLITYGNAASLVGTLLPINHERI